MCIDLRGVTFVYPGGQPALVDVDIELRVGESAAILGANGCGKSTLLKVANGLQFPIEGTVTAFGTPISENALRSPAISQLFRRQVGFVFQNADAQLFSATVREEIAFGPLMMGVPNGEADQRVSDVANLLGITGLLDRGPHQLSGGEKRKVALGSVLSINPRMLLLDEPTAGLNPRSQTWLVEMLSMLRDAGKTIVVATHDLDMVPFIADRVIVMSEEHRIVADGSPMEILGDTGLLRRVNLVHETWRRPY